MVQRRKSRHEKRFVDDKLSVIIALIVVTILVMSSEQQVMFAPPGAINVSDCQVLDSQGAYYVLNSSIVTTNTCFTVIADDIVLDGAALYTVTGPGVGAFGVDGISVMGDNFTMINVSFIGFDTGINIGGVSQAHINQNYVGQSNNGIYTAPASSGTVMENNFVEDSGIGILLAGPLATVMNNVIYNSGVEGIYSNALGSYIEENNVSASAGNGLLIAGLNNVLFNNTVLDNADNGIVINADNANVSFNSVRRNNLNGILVTGSDNSQIDENIIEYNGFSGLEIVADSDNNDAINNIFDFNDVGVLIAGASNNILIQGGSISNSVDHAISITSNDITIRSVPISDSGEDGINVIGGSFDVVFDEVSVSNSGFDDLHVAAGSSVEVIDGSIDTYFFVAADVLFSSRSGSVINYDNTLTGSGSGLTTTKVLLGYNFAYGDGTDPLFSGPAEITFYNIPTDLSNMEIRRDGVTCSAPECVNSTPLNAGTVQFNVLGFSNYTIYGEDLTPPNVLIINPDNLTYSISDFPIGVNVTLNENGSVEYSLDNGVTNVSMSSLNGLDFNASLSSLVQGSYNLVIYSQDLAGNENNSESVDFTYLDIDLVSPEVTINFPSDGAIYNDSDLPLNFNVELNEIGSAWFSYDNGVNNITMNTLNGIDFFYTNTTMNNGTYWFKVFANDSSGNVNSTESVTFEFNATYSAPPDVSAPIATVTSPLNINYTNGDEPEYFNVTLNEPGSVSFRYSGSAFNTLMNTTDNLEFYYPKGFLPDDEYVLIILYNDTSGNSNNTFAPFTINSSLPPNIAINVPTVTTYDSDDLPLMFDIELSELGSLAWYSLNGGSTNVTMNTTDNRIYYSENQSLSDGSYTFLVYANDTSGNVNSRSIGFEVDTTVDDDDDGDSSGSDGGSGGPGPTPTICGESVAWSCTAYGPCVDGTQTRTCTRADFTCADPVPTTTQSCDDGGTDPDPTPINPPVVVDPDELDGESSGVLTAVIFTLIILVISAAIIIVIIMIMRSAKSGLGVKGAGKSTMKYTPPRAGGTQVARRPGVGRRPPGPRR